VLVGIGTLAVAFTIGNVLEVPDRMRELASGDHGLLVVAAMLLMMALLLSALVSAVHGLRRLSLDRTAGGRSAQPSRPLSGVPEGGLPYVADDDVSLVPEFRWRDAPRRRVPSITSEC
jgi:hypothetical protein